MTFSTNLRASVHMEARLPRLARYSGKRGEFLLYLYEKISSRLLGQFCYYTGRLCQCYKMVSRVCVFRRRKLDKPSRQRRLSF